MNTMPSNPSARPLPWPNPVPAQDSLSRTYQAIYELSAGRGVYRPVGRSEVAAHSTLSVRTVSRCLGALRQRGLITDAPAGGVVLCSSDPRTLTPEPCLAPFHLYLTQPYGGAYGEAPTADGASHAWPWDAPAAQDSDAAQGVVANTPQLCRVNGCAAPTPSEGDAHAWTAAHQGAPALPSDPPAPAEGDAPPAALTSGPQAAAPADPAPPRVPPALSPSTPAVGWAAPLQFCPRRRTPGRPALQGEGQPGQWRALGLLSAWWGAPSLARPAPSLARPAPSLAHPAPFCGPGGTKLAPTLLLEDEEEKEDLLRSEQGRRFTPGFWAARRALIVAGVYPELAGRLAARPWVTPELVAGWIARLRRRRGVRNLGALLAWVLGDPAACLMPPEEWEAEGRGPGEDEPGDEVPGEGDEENGEADGALVGADEVPEETDEVPGGADQADEERQALAEADQAPGETLGEGERTPGKALVEGEQAPLGESEAVAPPGHPLGAAASSPAPPAPGPGAPPASPVDWPAMLALLRQRLGDQLVDTLLPRARPLSLSDGVLVVGVHSPYAVQYLTQRVGAAIDAVAREAAGGRLRVSFVLARNGVLDG